MINSFDTYFLELFPKYENTVLTGLSNLADPQTHLVFWGFISLLLLIKNKMKALHSRPFYLFTLTAFIMFVCGVLKVSIGRARPFLLDENIYGFFSFSTNHAYLSFPSSHSAMSVALAFYLRNFLKFPLSVHLFPIFIAISRLLLNEHFASDVLGGLAIGAIVSLTLKKYFIKMLSLVLRQQI